MATPATEKSMHVPHPRDSKESTDVDAHIEPTGSGEDSARVTPIDSPAPPLLATPESRRACARAAIREALDLCATLDGKPDFAALTAAEDRYNAVLAEELIASASAYTSAADADTWISIGPEHTGYSWSLCRSGPRGRTRMGGTQSDAIAAVVSWARNPYVTLGPFSQRGCFTFRSLADPKHTGRPTHVETNMWCPWWLVCVEALTSPSGADDSPDSVRPLDASFCATALILARALLDMGAERVGAHPCAKWAVSVEGGLSDHATRNRAQMSHDHSIGGASVPQCMVKWLMARAALVGFIGVMERVYGTHAIYDALGVAKFESDVVRRSMPSHLFS